MAFVRRLHILNNAAAWPRIIIIFCAVALPSIVFVEVNFRRLPDVDDFMKPVFHNPCYGGISADLRQIWPNVSRNSIFQVNLISMISKCHC